MHMITAHRKCKNFNFISLQTIPYRITDNTLHLLIQCYNLFPQPTFTISIKFRTPDLNLSSLCNITFFFARQPTAVSRPRNHNPNNLTQQYLPIKTAIDSHKNKRSPKAIIKTKLAPTYLVGDKTVTKQNNFHSSKSSNQNQMVDNPLI